MPELQIPLATGQQEQLDARVMPDGALRAVKDLVMERKWRLTPRGLYSTTPTTFAYGAGAGAIWAVNEFAGQRLLSYGAPPRLVSLRPEGTGWDASYEQVDLPTFNAAQRQTLPHSLGYNTVDVEQVDVATSGGVTVCAWQRGTLLGYCVIDEATQAVVHVDAVNGEFPKLVVSEAGPIVLVFSAGAPGHIKTMTLDPTDDFPRFDTGAIASIGTVADDDRPGCFDACAVTGTDDVIVAYYQSGTDPTVVRVQYHTIVNLVAGTGTATDSEDITVHSGSADDAVVSVTANSSWCFVAWGLTTAKEIGFSVGPGDVSGAFSSVGANISDPDFNGQLGIERVSGSFAFVVWASLDIVARETALRSVTASTGAAFSNQNAHYGFFPVSRPFVVDSVPYVCATRYTSNDSSGSTIGTHSYYIVRLPYATADDPTLPTQGFFARDVAHVNFNDTADQWCLSHVATDGTGNYLFAAAILALGSAFDRSSPSSYTNVQVGSALWRWSSTTRDKHQFATIGRAAYGTGGILTRWDGAYLTPAGFLARPDITVVSSGSSGSMGTGDYYYAITFERALNDGEVARSEPSFTMPAKQTLTGEVDMEIRCDPTIAQPNVTDSLAKSGRIYVYRTLENVPGTYYLTHNQDAPRFGPALATSEILSNSDGAADSAISGNLALYSDGTASPVHATPPPCRFLARAGKRLVAGGCELPEVVWFSQEHVDGEQVAWADDSAYKVTLPDACTAVGELDGYPVLFTARGIYTVVGAGPDIAGAGLFERRQLPSEVGAISHFVVTCDEGLCFQSERGIELLPRGFGPLRWIGAPVADTLGSGTITSAVNVASDKSVRFTCAAGVLVWNTTFNLWSVFPVGDIKAAGSWGGAHVICEATWENSPPYLQTAAPGYTPDVQPIVESGDITLGAISGFYRARVLAVVLRWNGPPEGDGGINVVLDVSRDSGQTWPAAARKDWDLETGDYSDGEIITLRYHVRAQKGDTLRFRLTIRGAVQPYYLGAGYAELLGFALEFRSKPDVKRTRAELRG